MDVRSIKMGTVFVFWLLMPGAYLGQSVLRQSAAQQNLLNSSIDAKRHAPKKPNLSNVELRDRCFVECEKKFDSGNVSFDFGNRNDKQPSRWQAWTYGFLSTSLINIASVIGYGLKPIMKKNWFGVILMFLVALAIGSMAGSGLLHLIPQGFGITDSDPSYIKKAVVISAGLYCFYMIDRILKIFTMKKTRERLASGSDGKKSALADYDAKIAAVENDAEFVGQIDPTLIGDPMDTYRTLLNDQAGRKNDKPTKVLMLAFDLHPITRPSFCRAVLDSSKSSNGIVLLETVTESSSSGHHHHHSHPGGIAVVAPVAWMVVIGDALHNFVDGVAIGAAFTDNLTNAISVCLAVAFEEIPNELGDFAVLLNSGLGLKSALMLNFCAACSNYLGLIVGICLGELSEIHDWIYCAAGGMFMYISLVVMVNELNHVGDRLSSSSHKPSISVWTVMLVQNIGLLSGYMIMLFFAVYDEEIRSIAGG